MICIECSSEVPSLYTQYPNGYIKLTYCNNCNAVSDKYVEFDLVILFIDILLLKPQAYKHLIFNTLLNEKDNPHNKAKQKQTKGSSRTSKNSQEGFLLPLLYCILNYLSAFSGWTKAHAQLVRLTVSFILFEVYLNWAYEELKPKNTYLFRQVLLKSTFVQYIFFFVQCVSEFCVSQLVVQTLIYLIYQQQIAKHGQSTLLYSKGAISTTVLIAGGTKLYPILMLIWPYDSQVSTTLINHYFTNLNLVEALRITVGISFQESLAIALISIFCKKFCSTVLLIIISKIFLGNEFKDLSFFSLLEDEKQHFVLSFYDTFSSLKEFIFQ